MRRHHPFSGPLVAGVLALSLTGCDDDVRYREVEGDEPITARAVAAVTLEHLATETSSRVAWHRDGVGAELRYDDSDDDDGDYVRVTVTEPMTDRDYCEGADGCEREDVEGGELIVAWQDLEPEEDPGVVHVVMRRDDEDVSVYYSGDDIEGDPRELDLDVSVADMEAVAQDGRISLTTSSEVIELGEELEDFQE